MFEKYHEALTDAAIAKQDADRAKRLRKDGQATLMMKKADQHLANAIGWASREAQDAMPEVVETNSRFGRAL